MKLHIMFYMHIFGDIVLQSIIEDLNMKLEQEFRTRRQLLLTRLDVTLQAFMWKKVQFIFILNASFEMNGCSNMVSIGYMYSLGNSRPCRESDKDRIQDWT